jgi:hypothetical protein
MRKQIKSKGFSILALLLVIQFNHFGQQLKFNPVGYSINPKFSYYNWTENDGGFTGGAEFNVLYNKYIFSIDYFKFEEWAIFSDTPEEYFNQIGLMFGAFNGDRIFRFQYQAGLASFWGLRRTELDKEGFGIFSSDEYKSENFFTVGIETKLGFKIIPLTFLSIGIDLQANINLKNTVLMPMLSIEIGKLRGKINNPNIIDKI